MLTNLRFYRCLGRSLEAFPASLDLHYIFSIYCSICQSNLESIGRKKVVLTMRHR